MVQQDRVKGFIRYPEQVCDGEPWEGEDIQQTGRVFGGGGDRQAAETDGKRVDSPPLPVLQA